MEHIKVFGEKGTYAGWPANHGHWQWGDEFLVGFIVGKYHKGGMHNVIGKLDKVLARSLDGGQTWNVELPNVDFNAKVVNDPPVFDLNSVIIRVCGNYDHGGDDCVQEGGFYFSRDKGKTWEGAYRFKGLEEFFTGKNHNTSRTCVHQGKVFLSYAARNHWGSDRTFMAVHDGVKFIYRGEFVLTVPGRVVMPAVASHRVHDSSGGYIETTVVAVRRRGGRKCWIDSIVMTEGEYEHNHFVHHTGGHNGNPPAIINIKGIYYVAFANRDEPSMNIFRSIDGENWFQCFTRKGVNSDIGYPRLFARSDGRLACVYYWADTEEDHQRIECTII